MDDRNKIISGAGLGFGVRGREVLGQSSSDNFENKNGKMVHSDAIWNDIYGTADTTFKLW